MTTRAEDVLYASLTDIDALEALAKIGLDPDCIPTEECRPMVKWALDRYFESGRAKAPSREMLLAVWGEMLEEAEIELIDEDIEIDTIESAIDNLKDLHAHREWQTFIKDASTEMATAPVTTKVQVLTKVTNDLFEVTAKLQDRSNRTTGYEGFLASLRDYDDRVASGHSSRGMTFGLDPIDHHTYGIHEGELAVVAAGPKVGKSYLLARVALHEAAVQGRTTVLYTLENSVEMTMDRLVCLHLGINPRKWQRGEVDAEKVEHVRDFIANDMGGLGDLLHVISPPRGGRTPEMLIREAKMLGADSVLVDQLTHVEHPSPGRKPRHELFNDNIHDFADLIKGRDAVSLLVAHQINREGVKAAHKQGYLEMTMLAESSGVERAADWVFGLYQSEDERVQRCAKFQIMAARREDTENWRILWDPESGSNRVLHRIDLEGAAA